MEVRRVAVVRGHRIAELGDRVVGLGFGWHAGGCGMRRRHQYCERSPHRSILTRSVSVCRADREAGVAEAAAELADGACVGPQTMAAGLEHVDPALDAGTHA